jgi:DNA uptake protein ComE-like DNA-binding protein
MINYISKYFTLNRRERNGVIAVSTLLLGLLVVKYFIIYKYNPTSTSINVIALDDIAAKLAEQNKTSESNNYATTSITKESTLFNFNPNTISYEEAIALGFPEKTAHILINYRNKGGKFYNAESLKKLYGMNEALYEKLAPYISIDNNKRKDEFKTENKFASKQQNIILEMNSADSLQWMQLKGIKAGRARMILKYKNLLGGFYSIEQLKEVYTFNDSLYNSIKANLTVNPALIQKLKVNTVDFKTMVHHPYIKYEGTKCIFALKKNKKITADDLRNSSCFSREQLEKVLIYLDFE